MSRGFLLLAAVVLLGAATKPEPWAAPAEWKDKPPPFEVTPAEVKAGQAIYAQLCVSCHGKGGRGDGPIGKSLKTSPGDLTAARNSVGETYWKLTNGRFPMPAFEERLKANERWQVASYVVSLQRKASTPEVSR
jgi:mono/diheme cytochrome c family protein